MCRCQATELEHGKQRLRGGNRPDLGSSEQTSYDQVKAALRAMKAWKMKAYTSPAVTVMVSNFNPRAMPAVKETGT